jgi:hypothetical protein
MVALNMALAAALELVLLFAVGRFAYGLGGGPVPSWGLALGATAATLALWGRFAAPRAAGRLQGAPLLAFKVAAFGAGAVALAGNGWELAAVLYAVVAALHLALASRLGTL